MNSSARTYFAHNEVRGDAESSAFASDLNDSSFLQDVTENGIPPSKLTLRTGDIHCFHNKDNQQNGWSGDKQACDDHIYRAFLGRKS